MVTEPRAGLGEEGFTLIEVLVAMLILAFGLLGLEALGIGAARSVAMADRQSEFAIIASTSLEDALELLQDDAIPTQLCQEVDHGALLSRQVDLSDPNRPEVVVRVIPDAADAAAPVETFELRSSFFRPQPLLGSANGSPCV